MTLVACWAAPGSTRPSTMDGGLGGLKMSVGFLVDGLTAMMMVR